MHRIGDFGRSVVFHKISPLGVVARDEDPIRRLFRSALVIERSSGHVLSLIISPEQFALSIRKLLRDERGKFGDDALDGISGELADDLLRH